MVAPAVNIEKIELIPGDAKRRISIRTVLDSIFKEGLVKLLRDYVDIFAWDTKEMPGIDESR